MKPHSTTLSALPILLMLLTNPTSIFGQDSSGLAERGRQPEIGKQKTQSAETLIDEFPFKLTDSNNISIRAHINKTDVVTLMFHTANRGIAITKKASERTKTLPFDKTAVGASWGGKSQMRYCEGNALGIGKMKWEDLRIFQDRHSGPGTDGKFGPDLFKNQVIEIDYDMKRLRIHSKLPRKAAGFQKLGLTSKNGMLFVTGGITVGKTIVNNRFLIHSGLAGGMLLDDEFVKTHDLHNKMKVLSESELRDSLGNVLKTKKIEIPTVSIADIEFSKVPAQIFDGAIARQKMSLIGGDLLKRFNILIDAKNQCLYVKPNSLFDAAYLK